MLVMYNPPSSARRKPVMPLSLLALGALLEDRHEYAIVDGNLDRNALETIDRHVRDGADTLAITVMPGPQLADAVPLSRELKARHPDLRIIWGGYFPTQHWDVCLKSGYVDYVVRGHGEVPEVDPAAWRLRVHGLVERELELSLSTLREAFREREVTATLQCAGNRRAGLMAIRDIPGEAPWGPGATGTATWTGVALADVLALARPLREAGHVGFAGTDLCSEAKPAQRFGGSIPLDKACRPEVLLVWAMNGEPLPLVHGAPLRVIVPGYIGARSVKWLARIEVRIASIDRAAEPSLG